jgi:hypothetical protein
MRFSSVISAAPENASMIQKCARALDRRAVARLALQFGP